MSKKKKGKKHEEIQDEFEAEPCEDGVNPDLSFDIDKKNFEWGFKEASYLCGFSAALATLGLSEESLRDIITTKINCEYTKEMNRERIEADEHIAKINSQSPTFINIENGDEE